jgi:hypothetical protein
MNSHERRKERRANPNKNSQLDKSNTRMKSSVELQARFMESAPKSWWQKGTHKVGVAVGAAATVLGLFWGFYSFRYDLSINPYMTLNPKHPFETRFAIIDEGPFSIHHVHYDCDFIDVHTPEGYLHQGGMVGVDEKTDLDPKPVRFSVHCQYLLDHEGEIDKAILQINVFFRPSLIPWELERGARFMMLRDTDGNVQWLPAGQSLPFPSPNSPRSN